MNASWRPFPMGAAPDMTMRNGCEVLDGGAGAFGDLQIVLTQCAVRVYAAKSKAASANQSLDRTHV